MLIKQLVWEGLNTPTSKAITVVHKEVYIWVLDTSDRDLGNGPIIFLPWIWMASLQRGSVSKTLQGEKEPQVDRSYWG